jgi:hypothetical protein
MVGPELGNGRLAGRQGDWDPKSQTVGKRIGNQLDGRFVDDPNRGFTAIGRPKQLGAELVFQVANLQRTNFPHPDRRGGEPHFEIRTLLQARHTDVNAAGGIGRTNRISRPQRRRRQFRAGLIKRDPGLPVRSRARACRQRGTINRLVVCPAPIKRAGAHQEGEAQNRARPAATAARVEASTPEGRVDQVGGARRSVDRARVGMIRVLCLEDRHLAHPVIADWAWPNPALGQILFGIMTRVLVEMRRSCHGQAKSPMRQGCCPSSRRSIG